MSKKEKPQKLTGKQRFFKALEIPISDVRMIISDNIRVEIEGRIAIVTYEENMVELNAGRLKIGFLGSNMQITGYDGRSTVIEGFINSVNYERG